MASKKNPQDEQDELRPPSWHDKHGRPELRMPLSIKRGFATPRTATDQESPEAKQDSEGRE